jgi:LPS-assembly lipoprotein
MRHLIVITVLASLVGACGFKPMYQTDAENMAISHSLDAITIMDIPDRLGQKVHNELLDIVTPKGEPVSPMYQLSVRLVEERDAVGLRQDASSTRANYRLQAHFRLVETSTDTVLIDGDTWSETSFDIVMSDYSTLMAERAAQDRLSRGIALEIRNRLALYFGRDQ